MKIIRKDEVKISDTAHKVDVKKLISYEYATIVQIELKPGESLKMHITPVDVCFYGLEGMGKVQIGKEIETITKDDLVFSPAKVPHKLFNESDKIFQFLVIKTPSPKESTKIL
ncbi:MAG: cupin domain-containing protein [Candidatus Lokiarchaeota archaeon]|nr:cupin domain-containing protein [Candidatus Lokiarchaeota archaeon]MBD3199044.1 cupin domain-containing protein [Candidatus Lokiarchaeota archaeon]